jgi:hypothetical protein
LPALAAPSIAQTGTDPIFALIERHKVAYRRNMECAQVASGTTSYERAPDYDAAVLAAANAAERVARKASDHAAFALTKIQPTTLAGVLALLQHVDAFNSGAFYLEPDREIIDWQSSPPEWPAVRGEDDIDMFGYALLDNVRRAIAGVAVQS